MAEAGQGCVQQGRFLGWLLKERGKAWWGKRQGTSPDDSGEHGTEMRRPGARVCPGVQHEAESPGLTPRGPVATRAA